MSTSSVFGSAASPVSIGGLESGLDTSSIIQALTQNEQTAVTTLQNQVTSQNAALTAWQSFNTDLIGLQSISSSLTNPSSFTSTQASIDQTNVASITTSTGATSGNHTLTVSNLAAAEKVLSSGFSNTTVPLNLSGSFMLNGKTINVSTSDTLQTIVNSINSSGAGVNATIVAASTGNNQISLTSSNTGTINALSASDLGGGSLLEQLGFVPSSGQTTALRQAVTSGTNGGAGSIAFAGSTATIAQLDGITGTAPSGTVTIGGTQVSLNLNTMSLNDVANAINSANIAGVQAQIVAVPNSSGAVNGNSQMQLQIVSTNGTPLTSAAFTDSGGVLSALGITQTSFSNAVTSAADAQFTLDGINYTRSSNTVGNVIPDTTLTLTSTNNATGDTPANVTISQNTSSITSMVQNFITAYNGVNDFINQQNTYSGPTASLQSNPSQTNTASPPLFGSYTLTAIQNQMGSMMDAVSGGQTMASIGITMSATGDLSLDTSTFDTALQTNPTAVAGLFGTNGTTTGTGLSYVASGQATKASDASGYAVNITQAASQAVVTGSTAYTAPSQAETLSFSGGFFGSSPVNITLGAGTTLSSAISQINSNGNLSQFLFASQNNGNLVLSSVGFGSNQSFTVTSNVAAASGSGIGTTGISGTGSDVKGTIDGEPATGLGTSLIGVGNNTNTPGLQLQYTGTATGDIGNVVVTSGASDLLDSMITSVTNQQTGSIAAQENSINSQITNIQSQITSTQSEVSAYESELTTEFNNMEVELANLKDQSSALSAETATQANAAATATGSAAGASSNLSGGTTNTGSSGSSSSSA